MQTIEMGTLDISRHFSFLNIAIAFDFSIIFLKDLNSGHARDTQLYLFTFAEHGSLFVEILEVFQLYRTTSGGFGSTIKRNEL